MNIELVYNKVKHLGLDKIDVINIIKHNKFLSEDKTIEKDVYINIFKDFSVADCSLEILEKIILKKVSDKFSEFKQLNPEGKASFFNGEINYHGKIESSCIEEIAINWITEKMLISKLMFSYSSVNKFLHIFIGNTLLSYDIKDLNINKTIRKLKRKKEYQSPYDALIYLKRHL